MHYNFNMYFEMLMKKMSTPHAGETPDLVDEAAQEARGCCLVWTIWFCCRNWPFCAQPCGICCPWDWMPLLLSLEHLSVKCFPLSSVGSSVAKEHSITCKSFLFSGKILQYNCLKVMLLQCSEVSGPCGISRAQQLLYMHTLGDAQIFCWRGMFGLLQYTCW